MGRNYIKNVFVIIFLLIALSASFAQESPTCAYCKEVIKGKYLKVDGKQYHPEHFLCKLCGKPIEGSFMRKDGGYYHPDCYSRAEGLFCDYCKKKLDEEYVVSNGKKYHRACYENYILPKCAVCNQPLSGYYKEDIYHNKYHSYHRNEMPICDCCNRIICDQITHGGKKYPDGRNICNICYASAIFDQGEIEKLLEKVAGRLTGAGIKFNLRNIKIIGVDRNVLKSKAKNYTNAMQGYCNSETLTKYIDDKFVNRTFTHVIYVLSGIPSLAIESTIAHELMHSWIFENTKNNLPDKICEGSCNYAVYLYLKSLNSNSVMDIIKLMEVDPDPVYGKGFLEIRERFENKPVNDFLSFLKNQ